MRTRVELRRLQMPGSRTALPVVQRVPPRVLVATAVALLLLAVVDATQPDPEIDSAASAVFRFAKTIGDGMVLQSSPKRAIVWGFCSPHATVSVAFAGKSLQAAVGPDLATGNATTWRVLLPPTNASFDQHVIAAMSGGTTLTIRAMFGDVFMCTGQVG